MSKLDIDVEVVNAYIDICVALDSIENDDEYFDKMGGVLGDGIGIGDLLDEMYNRMYKLRNQIIKSHPYFKTRKQWVSEWSAGDLELIMPFADGKVVLEYDGGWGESGVSKVVTNPTYLDMYALADELIRSSGDGHHIFAEGFIYERTANIKGVKYYQLATGS